MSYDPQPPGKANPMVVESSHDGLTWESFIPRAYRGALAEQDLRRDLTRFLDDLYSAESPELVDELMLTKEATLPGGLCVRIRKRLLYPFPRSCSTFCSKGGSHALSHWLGHNALGTRVGHSLTHAGLLFPEHISHALADDSLQDIRSMGPAGVALVKERMTELTSPYVLIAEEIKLSLQRLESVMDSQRSFPPAATEAVHHFQAGISALRSIDDPPSS